MDFVVEIGCTKLCSNVISSCNRQLRWNEMRLKQIQQEAESSQYKARTTRLAKWRELVVVAQRELELPPSAPEKLMLLDNA